MERDIKRYWPLFLLPTLLAFSIGFLIPFGMGLYLSFCDFTTLSNAVFAGFSNYARAFSDAGDFVHALWFTALFAGLSTVLINLLGLTVRSVNSMLASINCLFTFLSWHDLKVKTLKLQQQVYCPEEKELTKAEYTRLCRAAMRKHNKRLCLILQTICGTGIRVSELQFITIEAARCGEAVVSCKAKTRTVFLVKALRQKLLRYAAEQGIKSGMIFVTRTGKPVNRTNIWREMKSLCQEAGVNPQKVFPHNLRHLFARVFYGIEKDIAKLADILGHSSIDTTRIYIISTGTEHHRRMENMHLIL